MADEFPVDIDLWIATRARVTNLLLEIVAADTLDVDLVIEATSALNQEASLTTSILLALITIEGHA